MSDPLDINLSGAFINWRIHVMKRYAELMEGQLEEAYRMEMAAVQTLTDEDEYREQAGAIEKYYEEGFVPTFRYSFLVSLHMVVETSLKEFCNSLKRDRSLLLGPSDLRGKNLEPCRLFLTKVVGLKLDDFNNEWQEARSLQKVRDCIVHALGVVEEMNDDDKNALKNLVSSRNDITIDYDGKLLPQKPFCDRQVAALEALFDKLFRLVGWQK